MQPPLQRSPFVLICVPPHFFIQIKPLDEDKAIADGGDLLAEGFIYGLGAFLSKSQSAVSQMFQPSPHVPFSGQFSSPKAIKIALTCVCIV